MTCDLDVAYSRPWIELFSSNPYRFDDAVGGDNDGMIEPGETIEFFFNARNLMRWSYHVQASLSTNNPAITITSNDVTAHTGVFYSSGINNISAPLEFTVPASISASIDSFYLTLTTDSLDVIRNDERTHLAPNAPDDFLLLDGPIPHDWIEQGLIYIQDPSTSIACQLLEPLPEQNILDACGAPGGKTIWLAGAMKNSGRIVSCDCDEKRLLRLDENLKRSHVSNCELRQIDWLAPDIKSPDYPSPASFDSILIDSPCSNTGVMRRRIDVRWRLQPKDFQSMQDHQLEITRNCLPLLKPGGHLVYSTCSLEPEENQQAIDILLKEFPSLELESSQTSLPWQDGFDGAFSARLRLATS